MEFYTEIKPVPQNRKLRRGKGSRLFLDKDYSITWDAIQTQWRSQYHGPPLETKCSVAIEFGWSRMDIDSCIKPILDYLQGIAYVNDKLVESVTVTRCKDPHIKIKLVPWQGFEPC